MAITSSHNSVLLPIVWSAIHCRRQIRNHRKLCSWFITKQRKKNNKEKQKKGQKKKQKEKVYQKRRKIQCLLQTSPLAFALSINPTVLSFFLFFLLPKSENYPSCFDFVWFPPFFPPMGLSEKWKHVLLKTRIDIIN